MRTFRIFSIAGLLSMPMLAFPQSGDGSLETRELQSQGFLETLTGIPQAALLLIGLLLVVGLLILGCMVQLAREEWSAAQEQPAPPLHRRPAPSESGAGMRRLPAGLRSAAPAPLRAAGDQQSADPPNGRPDDQARPS